VNDTFAGLDAAIEKATPEERAGLVVQLAARLAALGAGLAQTPLSVPATTTSDRNLDIEETARRMGVSERYLYRRAKELAFVVREGRKLLFSERGLSKYMAQRTGSS
jgi:hypothetical protein